MSKYGLFVKDDPVYKLLIANGVRMFNLKVTNEQKLTPYVYGTVKETLLKHDLFDG